MIKWLIFILYHEKREDGLCVFYGMLDQAGINSLEFLKLARMQEKTIHRKFLNELGLQLAQPHMKRRLNKNLPGQLQKDIEYII